MGGSDHAEPFASSKRAPFNTQIIMVGGHGSRVYARMDTNADKLMTLIVVVFSTTMLMSMSTTIVAVLWATALALALPTIIVMTVSL